MTELEALTRSTATYTAAESKSETPGGKFGEALEAFMNIISARASDGSGDTESTEADVKKLRSILEELKETSKKNKDDIAIEYVGKLVEIRRKELEYLREKDYENLLHGKTELQKLHKFLNGQSREFDDLIEELFMVFPPEVYAEARKVTDASEQLSEDFGGIM